MLLTFLPSTAAMVSIPRDVVSVAKYPLLHDPAMLCKGNVRIAITCDRRALVALHPLLHCPLCHVKHPIEQDFL